MNILHLANNLFRQRMLVLVYNNQINWYEIDDAYYRLAYLGKSIFRGKTSQTEHFN